MKVVCPKCGGEDVAKEFSYDSNGYGLHLRCRCCVCKTIFAQETIENPISYDLNYIINNLQ